MKTDSLVLPVSAGMQADARLDNLAVTVGTCAESLAQQPCVQGFTMISPRQKEANLSIKNVVAKIDFCANCESFWLPACTSLGR